MKRRIISFILLLAIILLPMSTFADSDSLAYINNQAIINNDGTVNVSQTWHYDDSNTAGTEHYINMNINYASEHHQSSEEFISNYKVFLDDKPLEFIENWNVDNSFDQKSGKYGVVRKDGSIELCFGITKKDINRFRVEYVIHNAVKQTTDGSKYLHWTFTPTGLNPKPESLAATITTNGDYIIDKVYGFNYLGEVFFEDMNKKDKVVANMTEGTYSSITALNIFTLLKDDNNLISNAIPVNMSLQDKVEEIFEDSSYDINSFNEEQEQKTAVTIKKTPITPQFVMAFISGIFFLIIAVLMNLLVPIIIFLVVFHIIKEASVRYAIFKDFEKGELANIRKDKQTYYRDEPDDVIDFYPVLSMSILLPNDKQNLLMYFISKWTSEGVFEYVSQMEKESGKLFKSAEKVVVFKVDESKLDPNISELENDIFDCFFQLTDSNGMLSTDILSKLKIEKIEKIFARHLKVYRQLLQDKGYINGEDKEARLTEKGKSVIYQHLGLRNFLRDFTLINEREASEIKLWDFYFHMAAFYGMTDKFKKQLENMPNLNIENQQTYRRYYGNTGGAILNRSLNNKMASSYSTYNSRNSGGGGSSSSGGGGGSSGGGSGGGTR